MITESIKKLSTRDIYSILLFVLFKIKEIPSQSTLSELIYILDQSSLLKLCEYYGGQTIRIPTIEELEILTYCLLIYNDVSLEGKDFETVLKSLPVESGLLKKIRLSYIEFKEVLDNYEFISR
jgi:hypothetical protein